MVQERPPVYALLADGTTVEIRPAVPADFDAVKAMHEAMSSDNSYLRFFNVRRLSAEREAGRICRNPAPGSVALLAVADGEVVGVASYVPLREDPHTAEVAFAVATHMHHRGIATLLLEHLVSLAQGRQISTFTAETLTENQAMLHVFADAGLPVRRPLPGPGGGGRARRGGGHPAVHLRARVGRGDRREPAPRHGGPGHPGQHPGRRVRRPALRRQPARRPGRRRAEPG